MKKLWALLLVVACSTQGSRCSGHDALQDKLPGAMCWMDGSTVCLRDNTLYSCFIVDEGCRHEAVCAKLGMFTPITAKLAPAPAEHP